MKTKVHDELTIGELIGLKVNEKVKELVYIDVKAKKKKDLQAILDSIKNNWNLDNNINIASASKSIADVKQADDLLEQIDDSLAKIADVQSSKFAQHFADEAEKWIADLQMFQKFLMETLAC